MIVCKVASGQVQPGEVIPAIAKDISANLPDSDHYRYIYIHDGRRNAEAYVNTTVNQVLSFSGNFVNCDRITDNILRLDLRLLQSKHVAAIWERFRNDEPYFLANDTSEVIELVKTICILPRAINVYAGNAVVAVAQPGEYDVLEQRTGWVKIAAGWVQAAGIVVKPKNTGTTAKLKHRIFGPHLPIEAISIAHPVVRYDYFLRKAWSSDDIGLYYDFRGITPAPAGSGLSDYEHFLKEFAGITEAELSRFGIDPFKKVAILDSKVTGKPRTALLFSGAGSKVNNNQGLVAVTQDGKDNDDAERDSDPFRNLLQHRFNAMEVFVELPNGTIAYALFTGDLNGDGIFDPKKEGKLQKTAPPDVVADNTIPDPHTKLLQAGISCIRCHAIDKENGWRELPNDINTLFKSKVVDILDKDADLLASRYSGVLTKPLSRARDDLAEALTRITGLVDGEAGTVVNQVHGGIGRLVNEYQYTRITPELAAVELGVSSLENINTEGIEDNIIAILRANLTVSRGQFEKVYVDMSIRLNGAK